MRDLAALSSQAGLEARAAALTEPHMRSLEAYRQTLLRDGPVPHFDPFDGGDGARILLLLETPGPGAGPLRFTSRDNPTPTGANLRRFLEAAAIPRREIVIWNVVPWILSKDRVVAPTGDQLSRGLAALPHLLSLLPKLRVIALAGKRAAAAEPLLLSGTAAPLTVLRLPHPSPTFINTRPDLAELFGLGLLAVKSAARGAAPGSSG